MRVKARHEHERVRSSLFLVHCFEKFVGKKFVGPQARLGQTIIFIIVVKSSLVQTPQRILLKKFVSSNKMATKELWRPGIFGALLPAIGQVSCPSSWLVALICCCRWCPPYRFAAGFGGFGLLEEAVEAALPTTGLSHLPRLSPCHL